MDLDKKEEGTTSVKCNQFSEHSGGREYQSISVMTFYLPQSHLYKSEKKTATPENTNSTFC